MAGSISPDDVSTHQQLRQLFGITMEEHLVIEAEIAKEMKKDGKKR